MSKDWLFGIALVFTAVGYFCLGRLYEMRKRMEHWQRGFDEAEKIFRPRIPTAHTVTLSRSAETVDAKHE